MMKDYLKAMLFGFTVICMSLVIYAVLVRCFDEFDFGAILATVFGAALFNMIEEVKEKK